MIIWVSGTVIMFLLLAVAGVAMQIMLNIGAIIFNILMFLIWIVGTIIHVNQINESVFKATKLAGILSILSAAHAMITIMYIRTELNWELTTGKIVACALIFIAVIVINALAIYLTDEKKNNGKMMLITLAVIVSVALGGYTYFVNEDKKLAIDDVEEIYTYVVTADSAELYNVEQGKAYTTGHKEVISDTMGDEVIDICYKGDVLISENSGIGGLISAQKVRTEDGIIGYVYTENIEPYEYTTRYQEQYE